MIRPKAGELWEFDYGVTRQIVFILGVRPRPGHIPCLWKDLKYRNVWDFVGVEIFDDGNPILIRKF